MASSGQDVGVADSASSLRELALKTLKSRRKQQSDAPFALPPRPPPDLSFQLDYGQDESFTSTVINQSPTITTQSPTVSTPPAPVPKSPVVSLPKPSDVLDQKTSIAGSSKSLFAPDPQVREEGEISDEEDAQPLPAQPQTPAVSPVASVGLPAASVSPQAPSGHSQIKISLLDRLTDSSTASGPAQAEISSAMQIDPIHGFAQAHDQMEFNYIRPGIAMSQEQYDRAKDIVLDLLGWGVNPEYLVDCGVSREMVFHVFTELNLRMPQNLDVTGLIPHTPADDGKLQRTAMMPPPPLPAQTRLMSQSLSGPSAHFSVQTPSPPPSALSQRVPITPSQAFDSPRPVSESELHDMEQQKRQELQARKAAIASRKLKNAASFTSSQHPTASTSSSPPPSKSDDTGMNVDSVDDFLKTIGPSTTQISTSRASDVNVGLAIDDMDVDEIPGFSSYRTAASVPPNHPTRISPSSSLLSPTESSHTPVSPNQPPPSSTESASTNFTSRSTETNVSSSSNEARTAELPTLLRRGFRPVASDFVDFETDSRPPSTSSNGHRHSNGGVRRRAPGFASVINQPRCIIDVSDSEGEGDGDVVMRDIAQQAWRSEYASPVPTKPIVAQLNTNGWGSSLSASTPSFPSVASTPSGTMSPAALMAKETEIQRMREIIAQKERKLKSLLRDASSVTTTASSNGSQLWLPASPTNI
ncbi:hypothetical protein H0H92_005108 [Tricholoma furcatifolium]|nr:hypothetical protein H0H92_005108 [Tricholoma furcatifolium]